MSTALDLARPTFPKKPIGALTGYQNGKLDDRVLVVTNMRKLKANAVSARKMNALQGMAIKDGIPLTSTGIYRSFDRQVQLQDERYDPFYVPGRKDYNNYNGIIYSLRVGMAMAATPGTSDHGLGRSNDFAVMLAGDTIPDSLRSSDKLWLAHNAPDAGMFFDNKTEDWHSTDYAGDDFSICPLVLAYEKGELGPQIPAFVPQYGMFSLYPFDKKKASIYLKDPVMDSDLVAYFQGVLKVRLGYGIKIDGEFGPSTDRYARWFQGYYGLKVDGIVGPKTWAKVDSFA